MHCHCVRCPAQKFLLRPRERLRSIVMSMSVCGLVCLSARISPEPHAQSLPKFFVHVVCVRGSVLLLHVYDRPHRLSPGRGFLPHWKCIIGRERRIGVHSAGEVCYLWLPCYMMFWYMLTLSAYVHVFVTTDMSSSQATCSLPVIACSFSKPLQLLGTQLSHWTCSTVMHCDFCSFVNKKTLCFPAWCS